MASRSDVSDGWRDRRDNGGVVIDIGSGEVVVAGLSMPHSPRLHEGRLWLQIVSDVTGLVQEVPEVTIGASYGAAFLAAGAVADPAPRIEEWNLVVTTIVPDPCLAPLYDALYDRYLRLYDGTAGVVHELAAQQKADDAKEASA